jgi:branched-chain amino acid aminotransferase
MKRRTENADDRGAATIWVLGFGGLILAVALVTVTRGSAVLARHRLERAADLTALAAATQIGVGAQPCLAAGRIAIANAAVLVSCRCQLDESGRSGTVAVQLTRRVQFPLIGHRLLTSRARAGRLPASAQRAIRQQALPGRKTASAGSEAPRGPQMPSLECRTMPITVRRTDTPLANDVRAQLLDDPGFGRYFTDHMVRIDYADGAWQGGELVPYGPIAVDPATTSLHYGQSIFEGLKAYRQPDGSIATFRPEANAARFAQSARRLAMAELPAETFLDSLQALVEADRDWVPSGGDASLYLRPFMIATEVGLGVRPADAYSYLLIGSPAGAYFRHGVQPVSVWLSTEYTRAAAGGTGEAKCGGNYASSLVAQAQAAAEGCDQVVWLDAVEHRWVEEMGTNNLCFVYGSGPGARVMTPALTGTLLAGVTRDSLLVLARDLGYEVEEGKISVEQWRDGNVSGEITEVFACGTAAVVTPVGSVKSATGGWTVGDGKPGPVTMRLREALLGVQTGTQPDTHGWLHTLVKP